MRRPLLFIVLFATMTSISAAETPIYRVARVGLCSDWELVLYRSGYAHERSHNCEELIASHLYKISRTDIQRVDKIVASVRFMELHDTIDPVTYVSDEDAYIIEVLQPAKIKSVNAVGLERAGNRDEASRFTQVWKVIES